MQSSREQQGEIRDVLSEQCKERKENNRMKKTRDLFNKLGNTKGAFYARMEKIKGQKW